MGVVRTRTVATAAVREASNGAAFLDRVRELGLEPRSCRARRKAKRAGQGVLSAIPDADGIVGDLGGGSLELVEVVGRRGAAQAPRCRSACCGSTRSPRRAMRFAQKVAQAVAAAGFEGAAAGRPFYLVGGSWRALARLDMALTDHPLPITHQHDMADRPAARAARGAGAARQGRVPRHSLASRCRASRPCPTPTLLLDALVERAGARAADRLQLRHPRGPALRRADASERALDPLIEAAREAGAGLGRFAQHGDLLDAWIAPVFDDPPEMARLRLAACLLADIAWAAHPDFRAERGIDMALHGNWVAIDAPGRVMLAQALFCNFGGGRELPYPADRRALQPTKQLSARLGLGLRDAARPAAQRRRRRRPAGTAASAATAARCGSTSAARTGALVGETVERRLKTLGRARLGLKPEAASSPSRRRSARPGRARRDGCSAGRG